jgi:hypothetical protein
MKRAEWLIGLALIVFFVLQLGSYDLLYNASSGMD